MRVFPHATTIASPFNIKLPIGHSRAAVVGFVLAAGLACSTGSERVLTGGDGGTDSLPPGAVCRPGTGRCVSDTESEYCLADGTGYASESCDPVQGSICGNSGRCESPCAPATLGNSYIGCEYFPTILNNSVATRFRPAIAISNTSKLSAKVLIEGGSLRGPIEETIAPLSIATIDLQHDPRLRGCDQEGPQGCEFPKGESQLVDGAAYHVRSNAPVTVYQFNPLDFVQGTVASFSNDASLLFPTNAMGTDFVVPGLPSWTVPRPPGYTGPLPTFPAYIGITGTEDDTEITLTAAGAITGGNGIASIRKGAVRTLTIDKGEVMQLAAAKGVDLSGTILTSTKPIQVISGHACTNVPTDRTACDHLEETVLPTNALSTEYALTRPNAVVDGRTFGDLRYIRIVAAADDVTLEYSSGVRAATTLANKGDFIEIASDKDFVVKANKKIAVAQFMRGQGQNFEGVGDPAMTVAVPVDQYRNDYLFHAPTNYTHNFVNIIRPKGATVTLDDRSVSAGWNTIEGSDYEVARVTLSNSGDGNHTIVSNAAVGISVYGLGSYTSYWYPGGLNLDTVVVD